MSHSAILCNGVTIQVIVPHKKVPIQSAFSVLLLTLFLVLLLTDSEMRGKVR